MPEETTQQTTQQTESQQEAELYKGLFVEEPAPSPEPKKEEPKTEPADDGSRVKLSETYEANARLERQNRELKAQIERVKQLEALAPENPIQALEALGVDPVRFLESLSEHQEQASAPAPDPAVLKEIETLRNQQVQLQARIEADQRNKWMDMRKQQLASQFDAAKDKYQFAHMAAKQDPAFLDGIIEYQALHYQQHGREPTGDELLKSADEWVMKNFFENLGGILQVPAGRDRVQQELQKILGTAQPATQSGRPAETLTSEFAGETTRRSAQLTDDEAEAEFIRLMSKDGWND